MIRSGWRAVGVSPHAGVVAALALLAFILSRTAGAGWLVVLAAALVAVLTLAALWSVVGAVGLRVTLAAPTDATAGETMAFRVSVRSLVPQLRTLQLRCLDQSTHLVPGNTSGVIRVRADRRELVTEVPLEIRGGLPLGLFRLARKVVIRLPVALAVAPVPAVASLLDALGEDDSANVRTVRSYVRGDAPRLVHWRSSARRGELMVREFESAELLRGAVLSLRVDLRGEPVAAEEAASQAAGLAITALDAGMRVELLTAEASGARAGAARSRRDVGRRLAAAVPGEPPRPEGSGYVVEVTAR